MEKLPNLLKIITKVSFYVLSSLIPIKHKGFELLALASVTIHYFWRWLKPLCGHQKNSLP